jgi:hypothetical protein
MTKNVRQLSKSKKEYLFLLVVDTTNNSIPHLKLDVLNNQSSPSNDVFTNAPFKTKLTSKQRSIGTIKVDTTSPSPPTSQLINLNLQEQSTPKVQQYYSSSSSSSSRRAVGSAGLATNFVHFAGSNNSNNISNPDLPPSSSTKKRRNHHRTKMINDNEPEQHAYANLSFNDAIVDEFF